MNINGGGYDNPIGILTYTSKTSRMTRDHPVAHIDYGAGFGFVQLPQWR